MITHLRQVQLIFLVLLLPMTQVSASDMNSDVAALQHEWARIKYQSSPQDQTQQLVILADKARSVSALYPENAEPLIWEGIIISTLAGSKGGLGALSLAKESRDRLEKALSIDPRALDGSAYTSLGTLYYKVPGWPIGFGDSDKAEELLKMALDINPGGIDPNYFYGEFLYDEGRYAESAVALNRALQAPDRSARTVADAGRRKEIAELLAKVREHTD